MQFDAWIGPVIIASAIAGMVNVVGWFVTGRRDRLAARARRLEKQTDIATALLAEVTHYRDALAFFDLDDAWERVTERMTQEEDYMPVIPSERNDTIFRAILPDIHILPEDVIQPVTRYYNQVFAIDAIIEDLRSEPMRKEPLETRIAAFTDYISLKKQALSDGDSAITALSTQVSPAGTRSALTKDGAR